MVMKLSRKKSYELRNGKVAYDIVPNNAEDIDAERIMEEFAKRLTIIGCRHIIPHTEESVRPASEPPDSALLQPKPGNMPTEVQREYSILQKMPESFSVQDYVNYWRKQGNYDENELKSTFSYANKVLRDGGFVEVANPEANRTKWKYKVVAKEADVAEFRKRLKAGEKIEL